MHNIIDWEECDGFQENSARRPETGQRDESLPSTSQMDSPRQSETGQRDESLPSTSQLDSCPNDIQFKK